MCTRRFVFLTGHLSPSSVFTPFLSAALGHSGCKWQWTAIVAGDKIIVGRNWYANTVVKESVTVYKG